MQFIDFANAMMAARGSDSRFKSVASYSGFNTSTPKSTLPSQLMTSMLVLLPWLSEAKA
jgi:hypothetical protein